MFADLAKTPSLVSLQFTVLENQGSAFSLLSSLPEE